MRIVKVIIVMLLSMVLFTGCSGCETPQTVYLIGEEYTFETLMKELDYLGLQRIIKSENLKLIEL